MRRRNDIVLEGMRAGDLTDLVLPFISVDEFESKIDEDAIVVGFYVTDKDASDDLNRFIQRSPVGILDSDISPAPDQNGHYMVFVELLNNKQAAENITAIAEEVSSLCGIDRWDAQIRGQSEAHELEQDSLVKILDDNKKHDASRKAKTGITKESIENLLRESDLSELIVLDKNNRAMVCIRTSPLSEMKRFEVVAMGSTPELLRESRYLNMSLESVAQTNAVQRVLGPNWLVDASGDTQRWQRVDQVCLIVKSYD